MELIWKRIEAWLSEHAPEILNDLRPGASRPEIAQAEKALGSNFPAPMVASYQIHDGTLGGAGPVLGEWRLLSLDNVVKRWTALEQFNAEQQGEESYTEPDAGIQEGWWRRGWVPVASNGSGDFICVDLDPAPAGKHGQLIAYWHADTRRGLVSDTFESWLRQFADDLEAGKFDVQGGWLKRRR